MAREVVPVLTTNPTQLLPGTYWSLQKSNQPPWPARLFPELPVYALDERHFIVDDRAVDYAALQTLNKVEGSEGSEPVILGAESYGYDSTNLWLEIPTNGVASNLVSVILHNTSEGLPYTVLTKVDLALPSWMPEQVITGGVGDATTAVLPQNYRTNLFIWAHEGAAASYVTIVSQPLDQDVLAGDMVTFSVTAASVGGGNLTYQWTCNGTNIPGATSSSYTMDVVWGDDEGDYAVMVSNGDVTVPSRSAHLTVYSGTGQALYTRLIGPRQDYRFKRGHTYYVGMGIDCYGTTVIEGGAVIKVDAYGSDASLRIKGALVCRTEPYFPAIFTSVDDDSAGEVDWISAHYPQPFTNGVPYLDLSVAESGVVSNLHFRFADHGVSVPASSMRLDLWHCQFYQCNAAVESVAGDGAAVGFHNVLVAQCGAAVVTLTNSYTIEAEHLTADVGSFWIAATPPVSVSLTNSILQGGFAGAGLVVTQNTLLNAASSVFQTTAYAHYYLAENSPARGAGTTNVSPTLLAAMRQKTTSAPLVLPGSTILSGEVALFPQARRYTNGPPDAGYYYEALDYVVADLRLQNVTLTIQPGTALAAANLKDQNGIWLFNGVRAENGSHLVSRGTPAAPNIFTTTKLVQEVPPTEYAALGLYFGVVWFIPWHNPFAADAIVPRMDFEFTKFYLPFQDFHLFAGYAGGAPSVSYESLVDWSMKNCELRGGRVYLGRPHPSVSWDYIGYSTVTWRNNLFDMVSIELDPSRYRWFGIVECDVALVAEHNLFRHGAWLSLFPIPSTAGSWRFRDNLFDQVHFLRDTNAPLDFDYNGYWPVTAADIFWADEELLPMADRGNHEVTLTSAPPYESGPFGKYYLPMANPLYHVGSRSFEEAGMAQYTTRPDQITEGQEFSGHAVNIGLHYVATTNVYSQLPKDTDGDGIPDYVEDANGNDVVDGNETDPALPMTISGVHDSGNSVYDDIDLSGNGLAGRIKKALGLNPLDAGNPLTLKEVVTGEEPDFATFEVLVSYDVVTNEGTLILKMNGAPVTLQECARATNGNCLLSFNVAFDPMGQHCLAAEFRLNSDPGTEQPVVVGHGGLVPFYSSNAVQFFEAGSMFDSSGAYVDAKLFAANADYEIGLYDTATTPPTLIRTISNSTSNGFIEENWDGMLADGITPFTNSEVVAVFTVAYANSPGNVSTNKPKKYLTKAQDSLSEGGVNMDVVYFLTPTNPAWASAFAKNGAVWNAMQGVVDALINPIWPYPVYQSSFNRYLPDQNGEFPGYITKRARTTNDPVNLPTVLDTLLPDLTNGFTKQIYLHGHGTNGWVGSHDNAAYLTASDVGRALKNTYSKTNLVVQNPYRFVFIDGCSTASGPDWRRAFGIYPIDVDGQGQAKRNKTGAQAYVGWADIVTSGLNRRTNSADDVIIVKAYAQMLKRFYVNWMNSMSLKECIDDAIVRRPNAFPLPVPQNDSFMLMLEGNIYTFNKIVTSKIYIVGYPGLQVNGRIQSLDADRTYAAPKNIE